MLNLISEINQSPFLSYDDATRFLVDQAQRAGVRHISYWYLQYLEGTPDQVIWVATYDHAYMSHYMSKFTPVSDPVISSVADGHYVDWAEWFEYDEVIQAVAPLLDQYKITKYGISMPLQAPGEDKIIFSVCAESTDQTWPAQRKELAERFLAFGRAFDKRMQPLIQSGLKGSAVFRFLA